VRLLFYFILIIIYKLNKSIIYCSCLGHVVNLGNVDVMGHITKIAAVENATAIWEYDPTRADNRVLGGSLDVISAIRTLAIKVNIHINLEIYISPLQMIRFRHLDNVSNTFIVHSFVVDFLKL
jgi:hypothetical protein